VEERGRCKLSKSNTHECVTSRIDAAALNQNQ